MIGQLDSRALTGQLESLTLRYFGFSRRFVKWLFLVSSSCTRVWDSRNYNSNISNITTTTAAAAATSITEWLFLVSCSCSRVWDSRNYNNCHNCTATTTTTTTTTTRPISTKVHKTSPFKIHFYFCVIIVTY